MVLGKAAKYRGILAVSFRALDSRDQVADAPFRAFKSTRKGVVYGVLRVVVQTLAVVPDSSQAVIHLIYSH